jgi:hypothetical protein
LRSGQLLPFLRQWSREFVAAVVGQRPPGKCEGEDDATGGSDRHLVYIDLERCAADPSRGEADPRRV